MKGSKITAGGCGHLQTYRRWALQPWGGLVSPRELTGQISLCVTAVTATWPSSSAPDPPARAK